MLIGSIIELKGDSFPRAILKFYCKQTLRWWSRQPSHWRLMRLKMFVWKGVSKAFKECSSLCSEKDCVTSDLWLSKYTQSEAVCWQQHIWDIYIKCLCEFLNSPWAAMLCLSAAKCESQVVAQRKGTISQEKKLLFKQYKNVISRIWGIASSAKHSAEPKAIF